MKKTGLWDMAYGIWKTGIWRNAEEWESVSPYKKKNDIGGENVAWKYVQNYW